LWCNVSHALPVPFGDLITVPTTAILFETENERQKTKLVPIPLPRASRNFPDVKTRNNFFFYNWISEIIPFIHFGKQMDGS
jgi:hypothetical protein